MKKTRSMAASVLEAARQREVQREIRNFEVAIRSYPDGFAQNPYLSFEQHLFRIATESESLTGSAVRRRA